MLSFLKRTRAALQAKPLPDFLIIGAQRGGTTSLHHYLALHPDVLPADTKEVHFFDCQFERGLDWYRDRFPVKDRSGQRAGEASPYYLFHPLVPARVRSVLPDAKLIVLLRDPVERAWSHHRLAVHLGAEDLPFEEALACEQERLAAALAKFDSDPDHYSHAHQYFSYRARGRYADQLERWHAYFPREQMLILKSEDFYADPRQTYRQVLAFLELREWEPAAFGRHNNMPGEEMSSATRARLAEEFASHNERLEEILGWKLDWK